MFIGAGTITNVVAVLVGSGLGMLIGHRLPARVRSTVTAALGLVTLLIAAQSAADVAAPKLVDAVGTSAPTLVVLGSLVLGGIAGSLLKLEARLERFGGWMQSRMSPTGAGETRERFIEGFVLSSLVFCVGPLTILGSINEGLGRGADQLLLKSVLDGFASLAFAASFGIGVMASALSVALIQGSFTVVGVLLGSVLPDAHLFALTATGGLVLIGVAVRLLDLKPIPVADLLPALIVAPVLPRSPSRSIDVPHFRTSSNCHRESFALGDARDSPMWLCCRERTRPSRAPTSGVLRATATGGTRFHCFVCIPLLGATAPAQAGPDDDIIDVNGVLVDTRTEPPEPVPGVTVSVTLNGQEVGQAVSDADGNFTIPLPGTPDELVGEKITVTLDTATLPKGTSTDHRRRQRPHPHHQDELRPPHRVPHRPEGRPGERDRPQGGPEPRSTASSSACCWPWRRSGSPWSSAPPA